jgi:TRAP-type C4-dicarboxylate transport system substrate-binding protein
MERRILAGIIAMVLIIGIIAAGCGGTTTTPPKTTSAPATSAPAPITTAPATSAPAPTTSAPAPTTPAPAGKVYEWKMGTFNTTSNPTYKENLQKLVDMLNTAANGRLKVTLYPAESIVPTPDLFKAVMNNTIQASELVGSFIVGVIPAAAIEFGLPMTFSNINDAEEAWQGGMKDIFIKAYNDKGVHFLEREYPAPYIMMTVKQYKSLSELKGIKMRAVAPFDQFCQNLGTATVATASSEIYMALKLGTVDGLMTGLDYVIGQRVYEVCKYRYTPNPLEKTALNILINNQAWNELPPDLQAIVTKTADDWRQWSSFTYFPALTDTMYKQLKDLGVTFIDLPPADVATMQTAAMAVWDTYAAKDATCAAAVAYIKDFLKKKGQIK